MLKDKMMRYWCCFFGVLVVFLAGCGRQRRFADIDATPVSVKVERFDVALATADTTDMYQSVVRLYDEYPVFMLLNIILGASGLSSRLFRELREKKGLAYTVRTAYETHLKSAVFSIYIGTEPVNIETSINGFKEEIDKIKNIPISEEELHNAKNNLLGKQQFMSETNSQQANLMAYYSIMGKPFGYRCELRELINEVTPGDIQKKKKKYFTDDYVLSVLKP